MRNSWFTVISGKKKLTGKTSKKLQKLFNNFTDGENVLKKTYFLVVLKAFKKGSNYLSVLISSSSYWHTFVFIKTFWWSFIVGGIGNGNAGKPVYGVKTFSKRKEVIICQGVSIQFSEAISIFFNHLKSVFSFAI